MKENLVLSEKHFRFFDIVNMGILIIQDDKIKYSNQKLLDFLGYEKEQLINEEYSQFLDSIHPEDKPFIFELINKHLAEESAAGFNFEFRVINNKEQERYLEIHPSNFRYKEKPAIILFVLDKTQQKNSEKELQYYKMAVDNSDDIIIIINKNYELLFAGGHLKRHKPVGSQDLVGHRIEELIENISDLNQIKSFFDRCFSGETFTELLKRHYPNEGEIVYLNHYYPIRGDNDVVEFVLVIARDITKEKKTRERLQEVEREFQNQIESSPFSILMLDQEAEIIDSNAKFSELFEFSKEEIVGTSFFALSGLPQDKLDLLKERFLGYISGNKLSPMKYTAYTKSGKPVYVDPRVSVYTIGGKRFIQISIKDITKERETKRALKKSQREYKEALENANFFKDLLAHDIANILNNINISVEIININKDKVKYPDKMTDIINMIRNQTNKGIDLISNIRKIEKIKNESDKLSEVNVEIIIEKIINENTICQQDENSIILNKIEQVPSILAGPFLEDALENIIINGFQHNKSEEKFVEISIYQNKLRKNDYLAIDFADNGVGIPDSEKEIIFKRGKKKNKNRTRGMGLGLTLVKSIIEACNGKISVKNRIRNDYGQGSIFSVLFPLNVK